MFSYFHIFDIFITLYFHFFHIPPPLSDSRQTKTASMANTTWRQLIGLFVFPLLLLGPLYLVYKLVACVLGWNAVEEPAANVRGADQQGHPGTG